MNIPTHDRWGNAVGSMRDGYTLCAVGYPLQRPTQYVLEWHVLPTAAELAKRTEEIRASVAEFLRAQS